MLPVLDTLVVWWGERQAGELSIDKGGAMHFVYLPEWLADNKAPALSHAMPKQEGPFGDHACKAVLAVCFPKKVSAPLSPGHLGFRLTIHFVCSRPWAEMLRVLWPSCPRGKSCSKPTPRPLQNHS